MSKPILVRSASETSTCQLWLPRCSRVLITTLLSGTPLVFLISRSSKTGTSTRKSRVMPRCGHTEPDPGVTVFFEEFLLFRVKGGGSGPRVDFGPHVKHTQIGQAHNFAPADNIGSKCRTTRFCLCHSMSSQHLLLWKACLVLPLERAWHAAEVSAIFSARAK